MTGAEDHAAHCGPGRGFRVCYCRCPECRADGRWVRVYGLQGVADVQGEQRGGGPAVRHELLYVIPSLTRLKSPRFQRVVLPEIDSCVRFETPDSLKDLHRVQGIILCDVLGSGLLNLATEAAVRTRLRRDPHADCPAAAVDFSRYVWL